MGLRELEQILSKSGKLWTHAERNAVVEYFYPRFFRIGVARLVRSGVPLEENQNKRGGGNSAMDMMQNFFMKILERGCAFDPNNENNRGADPVRKFEAYIRSRIKYLVLSWRGELPEAVSLEMPINSEGDNTIGDVIASDQFTPEQVWIWDELQAPKREQLKIAGRCMEKLSEMQRNAVYYNDFEGKTYEEIHRLGKATTDGAFRTNLSRGRAAMAMMLAEHGIDYLELIKE